MLAICVEVQKILRQERVIHNSLREYTHTHTHRYIYIYKINSTSHLIRKYLVNTEVGVSINVNYSMSQH
jgi:hypothetical protein